MADTSDTKRRITSWSRTVHAKAVLRLENDVRDHAPRITGRLRDSVTSQQLIPPPRIRATIESNPGPGEPDDLPNWLDESRIFTIPRGGTGPKVLMFTPVGESEPIFRRKVFWRPRPGSADYWSDQVNDTAWLQALDRAASATTLPA